MLTLMGTIIITKNQKSIKTTKIKNKAMKNEARVCRDEAKQFTYTANNNNKIAASRQNTKSLINFDYNRCVFSTFLFSVRYSLICAENRGVYGISGCLSGP